MDTQEKIKVMQAYVDGKTIQWKAPNYDPEWADANSIPIWNWHECQYRIKPTRQPLTAADFPPGTVIREKSIPTTWYTVLCVTEHQLYFAEWYHHKFADTYFQENYEYSTDQGKTWKNCYK